MLWIFTKSCKDLVENMKCIDSSLIEREEKNFKKHSLKEKAI